ncbi:hypothetical protein KG892_04105 [Vermiphilus pyriformis]|nr:MAG: hypothetical protein KG892_04105 [Vermiphilus pyriformis]
MRKFTILLVILNIKSHQSIVCMEKRLNIINTSSHTVKIHYYYRDTGFSGSHVIRKCIHTLQPQENCVIAVAYTHLYFKKYPLNIQYALYTDVIADSDASLSDIGQRYIITDTAQLE